MPKIKPAWALTGLFILCVHNGYRVTQAFHCDFLLETAEKNLAMRLITRVDSLGINLEDHKILILGERDVRPYFPNNRFSFVPKHVDPLLTSIENRGRVMAFLQDHCFTKTLLKCPSKKEILNIKDSINDMPIWPALGSIRLIDDIVVIKLSEQCKVD